jgi:hypothetical protein
MSRENLEVVSTSIEGWNRDDLDAVLETLDPDIEFHTSGVFPISMPCIGDVRASRGSGGPSMSPGRSCVSTSSGSSTEPTVSRSSSDFGREELAAVHASISGSPTRSRSVTGSKPRSSLVASSRTLVEWPVSRLRRGRGATPVRRRAARACRIRPSNHRGEGHGAARS